MNDSASAPSLEPLLALTKDELVAVNALIIRRMDSPVALIAQLARHIIASGGKRLRPLLTLISSNLCGYEGTRHITLAACVEFIHTATLLHDDVVDDSRARRGQETANAIWDNKASVLVGDFLFSRAFELMVMDGSLEVLQVLSGASSVIAEGEVMQMVLANDPAAKEDAYFRVISAKTAKLFSAAAEIGAIIAERDAPYQQALSAYGHHIGVAFQLVDDVLDYDERNVRLDKNIGDDFREGKITLPVIIAYQHATASEQEFWHRTLGTLQQHENDLKQALALMNKYRALEKTRTEAKRYSKMAHEQLAVFPNSPYKDALCTLADFAVARLY